MKITHGNQTIDLFTKTIPDICPISLSGGADSASLFYLVSKHFPNVKIIPYTCKDLNAPKDADAAQNIVKWMQKEFPKNNIPDIEVYEFNDRTEDFVSWEECDDVIKRYPQFVGMRRIQISKIIQLDRIAQNLMKRFPNGIRLDGMTRNPPSEIMKKLDFYDKAERRRDKELPPIEEYRFNINHPPLSIYQPYANVDKKFVAGVYIDHNLMDSLFPMTRSCVGRPKETDNFTKECHKCFWCHEKKWAFNLTWNY
jgi:3'-phosphoadenosine 5'-phosphosulfate sulfotransferase (PAPS reductase)/FAD synthetase